MENKKSWEYMHTEEYAQKMEKEEWGWNQKNKKQQEIYIEQIEERLQEGTEVSRKKLLALFNDKEFIETYKTENDFAYMIVIMQIYENEKGAGEEKTILDLGKGRKEIIEELQKMKFILWRIEFAKDVGAKDVIVEFIKQKQATPEMLRYVIHTSVYDKQRIVLELADLFIEQNMFRYAFRMLEYAEELSPGNEEVLCILAQLCICVGSTKRAGEYLDQIKNPGKLTEGIRKKYGC